MLRASCMTAANFTITISNWESKRCEKNKITKFTALFVLSVIGLIWTLSLSALLILQGLFGFIFIYVRNHHIVPGHILYFIFISSQWTADQLSYSRPQISLILSYCLCNYPGNRLLEIVWSRNFFLSFSFMDISDVI